MKALKWIAVAVGGLVGLLLLAVVAATVLVDPNDYRNVITDKVYEATGRELKIEGDIRLSFFPWLGLKLGSLELGNAEGFGSKPFASIGGAEARVKIVPLFSGKVEMDKVVLHGLSLDLARRADGTSNWDDLAGKGAAADSGKPPAPGKPAKPAAPAQKLAALAIGGIEISKANVAWQDDMAKQRVALSDFNLTSGAISLEKPFPLTISGKVDSSNPALGAAIDLKTVIGLDLNNERYRLDDLNLALDADGKMIPGGKIALTLGGDVFADLKQQTAAIKGFALEAIGVTLNGNVSASNILAQPAAEGKIKLVLADPQGLSGVVTLPPKLKQEALKGSSVDVDFHVDLGAQSLKLRPLKLDAMGLELTARVDGRQIIDNPSFSGDLASGEFVPRRLMKQVGVKLPEMADPGAMGKAKFSADFNAGLDHAALDKLKLQLDNTTLNGSASVKNFKAPIIRYQLAVDDVDVDRYLPPPSDKPAPKATPATASAAAATTLPLKMLRSLDIDGTFKVGKVKVMNLHSNDIVATVRAAKGKFRVNPLGAKLYKGSYAGDVSFDVSGKTPLLGMNEKLSGVQAGPLLKDFMGKDYVTGKANMSAKITARGIDPMAIRKSLNGRGGFSFENGQVKGLNIGHLIRVAYAKVKEQSEPKEETRDTDFSDLKGSFTVKNGLVNTKDLYARSPLFQVKGKGKANLANEKLDMRLETTVVGNLQDAANQTIGELKGTMIPITIKGKFSDPDIGVDVESVLRKRAEKELRKTVKKKKKELEEDAKKQLEDALKGKLKF